MPDRELLDLSRRKLLGGLATIGGAGALGGASSAALLWDEEKYGSVTEPNVLQGGKLNLTVSHEARYYDGISPEPETVASTDTDGDGEPELTDQPEPTIELSDLKPGDVVEQTIGFHVSGNPGFVGFEGAILGESENDVPESEDKVDGHTPNSSDGTPLGDLARHMRCLVWYDGDSDADEDSSNPGNNFPEELIDYSPEEQADFYDALRSGSVSIDTEAEEFIFGGTLRALMNTIEEGVFLDPFDDVPSSFPGSVCFRPSTTHYLGMLCWLPRDIPGVNDNLIQTDSLDYQLKLFALQCRHNVDGEGQPIVSLAETTGFEENVNQLQSLNDDIDKLAAGIPESDNPEQRVQAVHDKTEEFKEILNGLEAQGHTAYLVFEESEAELLISSPYASLQLSMYTMVSGMWFSLYALNAINLSQTFTAIASFMTNIAGTAKLVGSFSVSVVKWSFYNYYSSNAYLQKKMAEEIGKNYAQSRLQDVEDELSRELNADPKLPNVVILLICELILVIRGPNFDDIAFLIEELVHFMTELGQGEFTVEQGDTTYPISSLSNGETIETFYDYYDVEAHTSADIEQSNVSTLFLWEGPKGTSLVVVHDRRDDNTGGEVTFTFTGLPEEGSWVIQDDSADDSYDDTINWWWVPAHTDGGAFRGGLDDDFEVTIDPDFKEGITDWQLVYGNLDDPTRKSLDMNQSITISR